MVELNPTHANLPGAEASKHHSGIFGVSDVSTIGGFSEIQISLAGESNTFIENSDSTVLGGYGNALQANAFSSRINELGSGDNPAIGVFGNDDSSSSLPVDGDDNASTLPSIPVNGSLSSLPTDVLLVLQILHLYLLMVKSEVNARIHNSLTKLVKQKRRWGIPIASLK